MIIMVKKKSVIKKRVTKVKKKVAKKKSKSFKVKQVKGAFELPIQTVTIVPSTTSKNKPVSASTMRKRVDSTRRYLSKTFGGFTSVNGTGGFVSSQGKTKGKLIKEPVVSVTAYSDKKTFKKNKNKWLTFIKNKGRKWKQESMGIIIENDLKYVDSAKKKTKTKKK